LHFQLHIDHYSLKRQSYAIIFNE